MGVATFEGVVEHGRICLKDRIHLPENTKVLVVVPELEIQGQARVVSPRLANPAQAADFEADNFC